MQAKAKADPQTISQMKTLPGVYALLTGGEVYYGGPFKDVVEAEAFREQNRRPSYLVSVSFCPSCNKRIIIEPAEAAADRDHCLECTIAGKAPVDPPTTQERRDPTCREMIDQAFHEHLGTNWRPQLRVALPAATWTWIMYLAELGMKTRLDATPKSDRDAAFVASMATWEDDLKTLAVHLIKEARAANLTRRCTAQIDGRTCRLPVGHAGDHQ